MNYEIGTVCTKCGHGLFVSFCKKCGDLEKHDDAIRLEILGQICPNHDHPYAPCPDGCECKNSAELVAILGTEPAREAIGTESNPFKGTYNAMVFKRHDSDLKLGVCERDDGFEFVVHGTNNETSHYALHPDAIMERLDEPAREDDALSRFDKCVKALDDAIEK